jgi:ABC-2 type transport system ATP-binding protein
MGAGAYVGRIGGLAAALGIGAAVFIGAGVASAEPSATSESGTSGSESSSTESTQAKDEKPAVSTDSSDEKPTVAAPKKKKKSSGSQQSTRPTSKADEPKAKDSAPTTSVTVSAPTTADVVVVEKSGDAPDAPVESPLPLMMMAAARKESSRTPTLAKAADTVTTSADTTPTVGKAPGAVVAIPQTAPLEGLQHLPIVGPMFVTPVVAFIHQIPLIGDVLHPFVGYPVRFGLAPGTPVPRDVKVISFDGTPIYVHFMPAAGLQKGQRAPSILDGPGLALPGATNPDALSDEFLPNDVIGVGTLRHAGYNVITWDPRGEWSSGGQLQVDHPDFEGKDVSAIISWLATQPEVQMDDISTLDPRIGMVGASYGGGIQLATAVNDRRIDAIVPTIAWHSLNTSLYKDQAFKSSWGTILSAALIGTFARVNPRIYPGLIYGDITGTLTPADQELIDERGPDELVNNITAPTLLIQGTVDTLFTLAEADANAKILIANGVPTKVVWFCGGHGACLTTTNNGELVKGATLDWLNRYVKGDLSVDTGAQFEWVDQHGTQFSSETYPVSQGTPVVATSTKGGVLTLFPFIGGSGPEIRILTAGPLGALLGIPSGSRAINALNLKMPDATTTTYIVGAPQLTLTYSGTGTSRHVYAQLVDDSTGLVLGNLVTPVPVTLDGHMHTVSVPLEMVAHTLKPGESVTLQVVASAFPYETITSLGQLNVSGMSLSLPTADAAAISTPAAVATSAA